MTDGGCAAGGEWVSRRAVPLSHISQMAQPFRRGVCAFSRGNHPSAKFWRRVLLPVIARYQHLDLPKLFRGDSAFALPKLLRLLEKEGFRYAIRLKANPVLKRKIAHLLKRPVGRPS